MLAHKNYNYLVVILRLPMAMYDVLSLISAWCIAHLASCSLLDRVKNEEV